jgi:tRNA modification GTPase
MVRMTSSGETIFAPASGHGRAAVAVIRISGPRTRAILESMAGGAPPSPRQMALRRLIAPATGEELDQALVVWMPGPASFTGEDQAELQIHGGAAVRAAVLKALSEIDGCRPAEPGEFTRRAFLNGRMDLSAVEGLADLIDAETEAQRRQALRQLEGRLGRQVEGWRERAISVLALLEAALDFSDEGDVPATLERQAAGEIGMLSRDLAACLDDGRRGERLREGFTVVLAGPPNAGKSTLLNALTQRDVAIVSPLPGTTRDAIEVRCDLGGLPVSFIDTAGVRETGDPIEREGVARTRAKLRSADLVLWLAAADELEGNGSTLTTAEAGAPLLRVGTKSDLGDDFRGRTVDITLSAQTGAGMSALLDRIALEAERALGGDAVLTRERHRAALERAAAALVRAEAALRIERTELAAEDVRLALRALGEVTGRVDVDEVLDRLFATFCIGK